MSRPMTLCDNPVFIVGAPRSGTTLLRSILDAHPRICCPNWETGLFEYFQTMANGDFSRYPVQDGNFPLDRAGLVAWMRRCTDDLMHQLVHKVDKPRWAEKTPAHVFCMDLIAEAYPRAQFIHIVRNGRDVIRSLQNMPWAPRKIGWSARRWVESVEAGRAQGLKLGKDRYLELRYEQLVQDAQNSLNVICKFLGEQFSPQMLAFNEPGNNSWGQALTPLKRSSETQYPKLKLYEELVVWRIARSLLRKLGYR